MKPATRGVKVPSATPVFLTVVFCFLFPISFLVGCFGGALVVLNFKGYFSKSTGTCCGSEGITGTGGGSKIPGEERTNGTCFSIGSSESFFSNNSSDELRGVQNLDASVKCGEYFSKSPNGSTSLSAPIHQPHSHRPAAGLGFPASDFQVLAPDAQDAALFQRALLAETEAVPGPGTIPKVAFMFLTRGPLPLAKIWAAFFANNTRKFSVFIHTAPNFKYKKGELPKVFRPGKIRSKVVKWGDISMVDAERRLIASALLDPANTRFVLLSESCIPLFNFTFVYNYLMESPLSFLRMKVEGGLYGAGRWSKGFLPIIPRDKWRKGGQWFSLTRDAAMLVVGDTAYYPEFRDHCSQSTYRKPSCYADEHYMQTMLPLLQPEALLESRSLTWAAWSSRPGYGQHPELYRRHHISHGLFTKLRGNPHCRWKDDKKSYCYLFARKFHPDSLQQVLLLTPYLGY